MSICRLRPVFSNTPRIGVRYRRATLKCEALAAFGEHSLAINDDKASYGVLLAGRNLSGTPAERHDMHDERRRSVFIMNNERPFLHRSISPLRSGSYKRLQFSRRHGIDCTDAVAFAAQAFAHAHESFGRVIYINNTPVCRGENQTKAGTSITLPSNPGSVLASLRKSRTRKARSIWDAIVCIRSTPTKARKNISLYSPAGRGLHWTGSIRSSKPID